MRHRPSAAGIREPLTESDVTKHDPPRPLGRELSKAWRIDRCWNRTRIQAVWCLFTQAAPHSGTLQRVFPAYQDRKSALNGEDMNAISPRRRRDTQPFSGV